MNKLKTLWNAESALVIGIVLALVGAGFIPGAWGKLLGAVLPLLGAGAVRQTVWAPDTAVKAVGDTAQAVAAQVTPDIAGAAGQVLPQAQAIVDGVVTGVLGK